MLFQSQIAPNAGTASGALGHGAPADMAVYVHCSGGSARQWGRLWSLLPGLDHFGFDLIGHGKAEAGRRVTLEAELGAIDRLCQEARKIDLIGHSYGGAVALRYALRRPERLRSLILIEPSCFSVLSSGDGSELDALDEIRSVAHAVRKAGRVGLRARGMDIFVDYWGGAGSWRKLNEGKREQMIRMAGVIGDHFEQLLGDSTPLRDVSSITVPTLILCGTRSPPPSRAVTRVLARAIGSAIHRTLPDVGHMAAIAAPEPVAAAIGGFLAKVVR